MSAVMGRTCFAYALGAGGWVLSTTVEGQGFVDTKNTMMIMTRLLMQLSI